MWFIFGNLCTPELFLELLRHFLELKYHENLTFEDKIKAKKAEMTDKFDEILTSIAKWILLNLEIDSSEDEDLTKAFLGAQLTQLMAKM